MACRSLRDLWFPACSGDTLNRERILTVKNGLGKVLMLAIGLSATLAAQADGSAVCEDELDVVECLSRWSGEEQEIDLRTCWSIEKQNEIPLSYSAVGWGTEAAPAGEVRLVCVDGSFNAGVFFPSLTAFDLAAGLTGKGVYRWHPLLDWL